MTDNDTTPTDKTENVWALSTVFNLLAAFHDGDDMQELVDEYPQERRSELFVFALAVAYTATVEFCAATKIDVDEFLSARHDVISEMQAGK